MCGLSGGADSTALVALAIEAGCAVTAVHVDHGLRPGAHHDADIAATTAARLGAEFRVERVELRDGPNLEARARAVRRSALGPGALTGHTADDQAETVLLALLRGSGATGLGAIEPGPQHPILGLRRSETEALCRLLELDVADDPTNTDRRFRRNRIRHEVIPLLDDIAERDVTVLLNRTASLLRADDQLLDDLAASLDPTDVDALIGAPVAVGSASRSPMARARRLSTRRGRRRSRVGRGARRFGRVRACRGSANRAAPQPAGSFPDRVRHPVALPPVMTSCARPEPAR